MNAVTAYLSIRDVEKAIEFYRSVFGAEEIGPRISMPDGTVAHTELKIDDTVIMMAEESPEWGNVSPLTLGDTPVRLSLVVKDADATVAKAVEHGAELAMEPADQFYGLRSGRIVDPFGHIWIVSHVIEELSAEEMQRRADDLFQG